MNELKIRVIFDTGQAKTESENLGTTIKKVTEITKSYEGSVNDLTAKLKLLTEAQNQYKKGSEEYIILGRRIAEINNQLRGSVSGMSGASANAATTLQALNYTIRDAPYFARDFSLGLLAIGNNLNPLIDGFIRMRGELKEGQTLWSAFKSSMSSAQWTILGFSAAVSIIQAITFALAATKKEAKEATEEIDAMDKSLQRIRTQTPFSKGGFDIKPEDYSRVIKELDNLLESGKKTREMMRDEVVIGEGATRVVVSLKGINKELDDTNKLTEGAKNKIKEFRDELKSTEELSKLMGKLGIPFTTDIKLPKIKDTSKKDLDEFNRVLEILIANFKYWNAIVKLQQSPGEPFGFMRQTSAKENRLDYGLYKEGDKWSSEWVSGGGFFNPLDLTDEQKESAKNAKSRLDAFNRSLTDTNEETKLTDQLATTAGNSLVQMFAAGKLEADKLLGSMLMITAQLAFIEGLKFIFSGGTAGLFGGNPLELGRMTSALSPIQSTQMPGVSKMVNSNSFMPQQQPIIFKIDTDLVRVTREKINPIQRRLTRNNVKSVV